MEIINLASGSKGNSTYIKCANTHILVDVGVSFKEINSRLASAMVDSAKIDAILITHDHTDHTKGLFTFIKMHPHVAVYAHPKTMTKLCTQGVIPSANQNFILSENFYIKDLTVSAFSLPHDSEACLGYSFYENGKKFSIATDLGYASEDTLNCLSGSDLIFIEANYNEEMLANCPKYPAVIKARIASNHGHLSNSDCARVIEWLFNLGTARFVLSHISENTNTPQLALSQITSYLGSKGIIVGEMVEILQNNQYTLSKTFII